MSTIKSLIKQVIMKQLGSMDEDLQPAKVCFGDGTILRVHYDILFFEDRREKIAFTTGIEINKIFGFVKEITYSTTTSFPFCPSDCNKWCDTCQLGTYNKLSIKERRQWNKLVKTMLIRSLKL